MKKWLLFLLFLPALVNAQKVDTEDKDLIQFSGVVVTSDSLFPVPFATIMVKGANRGTVSDFYGYYSFVAKKGDVIRFSSVGYKAAEFKIPDTLSGDRYSMIQMLNSDTVFLPVTNIYPWPSWEQFKNAFLYSDIPDDDLEIARKNLSQDEINKRMQAPVADAGLNYKFQMQQKYNQLYYAGQYVPIQVFNPIAWAKFVEAWRRGDFKKKDNK